MSTTIGVDIGGTKIAAGVVDSGGRLIASARKPTPARDPAAVVQTIAELVAKLRRKAGADADAIGVGTAGLVDAERSQVLLAPNLGWVNEPLRIRLQERTGLPCVIENDANAAAWGEYVFGAGREFGPDMVMVTIGTGIGGGLVVGGRLRRGAHGLGAEFGHMTMVPGGRSCGCGKSGCWEQYGSGNALVRTARKLAGENRAGARVLLSLGDGTPEGVQGVHVTEAAEQGDEVALAAFARVGEWIGSGLADLASLLDPAVFVIGGGAAEAGELLLAPARESFARDLVARAHRPLTPIVPAEMGNRAGIVGAADLARQPD